ncbi:hypothetical protein [Arthrobacter sp. ES1]|uniref:hypothetical protein n=1 Tax=Arthrobacter sp. ES1 TaxID=1897056 RepID=UPI001CFF994E|nr:hypothetical protein [Arthrobacter sp. ES1]MCB5280309.1 hypothetical protein [Arthrobacter sp. ES1]
MKNADLEVLRAQAADSATGTVTVDAAALLALLSHVDELRTDLHNIDEFIDSSELEEEGYSATVWAWNNIVGQFREVPRLSGSDIDVVDTPVIERLDTAEDRIAEVRGLAQRAINRYNHQTMIKAKTVIELLDGTLTYEQLTS